MCAFLVPSSYAFKIKIATVKEVKGRANVLAGGKLPAIKLGKGIKLFKGDVITVGRDSNVQIDFEDGNIVVLSQKTRMEIREYSFYKDNDSLLVLTEGSLRAKVNKSTLNWVKAKGKKKFEVQTPNAVAGVRGTDFFVTFLAKTTIVSTSEGKVYVFNRAAPEETVEVIAGKKTLVKGQQKPGDPVSVNKSEIRSMLNAMHANVPEEFDKDTHNEPAGVSGNDDGDNGNGGGGGGQTGPGNN